MRAALDDWAAPDAEQERLRRDFLARLDDGPRHTIHDAGFLRFSQNPAAFRLDPGGPLASVGPHAGQDGTQHARTIDLRG